MWSCSSIDDSLVCNYHKAEIVKFLSIFMKLLSKHSKGTPASAAGYKQTKYLTYIKCKWGFDVTCSWCEHTTRNGVSLTICLRVILEARLRSDPQRHRADELLQYQRHEILTQITQRSQKAVRSASIACECLRQAPAVPGCAISSPQDTWLLWLIDKTKIHYAML